MHHGSPSEEVLCTSPSSLSIRIALGRTGTGREGVICELGQACHASRTRTDRGSSPPPACFPQDPIRRTCSWAGRGPLAQSAQKGYCAMRGGCWVRRVPCETSHTHSLYAHIRTSRHTPTQPHTHTHTHVCHEWPLAEGVLQSSAKQERVGAPDDFAIGRCRWVCLGVSRNRPENSKMLYSAVSLSIRASRTFFSSTLRKTAPSLLLGVASCVLCVFVRLRERRQTEKEKDRLVTHALAPRSDDVHRRPSLIS